MKTFGILALFFIALANGHVLVRRQATGSGSLSTSVSSPAGSLGLSATTQGSSSPSASLGLQAAADLQAAANAASRGAANAASTASSDIQAGVSASSPSLPSSSSFSSPLAGMNSNSPNPQIPLNNPLSNLNPNFGGSQAIPPSASNIPLANSAANSPADSSPTVPTVPGISAGLNLGGSLLGPGLSASGWFGANRRVPSFSDMFSGTASSLGNLMTGISGEGLRAAVGGTAAARDTIGNLADQGNLALDAGVGLSSDTLAKIQSSLNNYATNKLNLLNRGIRTSIDAGGSLGQTGLGLLSLYPRLGLELAGAFGR